MDHSWRQLNAEFNEADVDEEPAEGLPRVFLKRKGCRSILEVISEESLSENEVNLARKAAGAFESFGDAESNPNHLSDWQIQIFGLA